MKKLMSVVFFGLFLFACSSGVWAGEWQPVGEPFDSNGALISSGAGLYRTVEIRVSGLTYKFAIYKWISPSWQLVTETKPAAIFSNFVVDSTGNIYAALRHENYSLEFAKWDGSSWSYSVSNLSPGQITYYSGALYGVGYFFVNNAWHQGLAKLDLAASTSMWSPLGPAVDFNYLKNDDQGNLYLSGRFKSVGDTTPTAYQNVVRYNIQTNSFSALGALPVNASELYPLAIRSGDFYAGYLDFSVTSPSYGVLKWNGASWSIYSAPPGSRISQGVFDSGGNLFVRDLSYVDGYQYVGKLSGSTFSPLPLYATVDMTPARQILAYLVSYQGEIYAQENMQKSGDPKYYVVVVKWVEAAVTTTTLKPAYKIISPTTTTIKTTTTTIKKYMIIKSPVPTTTTTLKIFKPILGPGIEPAN